MVTQKNLRELQRELTRDLILQALAEIIASSGLKDFTTQELAKRSGVSAATIYRYFLDRDTLLREFLKWAESQVEQKGRRFHPRDVAELGHNAVDNYAVYEECAQFSAGILKLYAAGDPLIDQEFAAFRREVSAEYEMILSKLAGDLDAEAISTLAELIPYLSGIRVWSVFRENPRIDIVRAGEVVAWVTDLIVQALSEDGLVIPHREAQLESGT
ncbi:MAG: TetR/AcrR family transcriptional regulator [Thermoleophilia bacterium]|nr:TetR/AcrR family transcriptional regulator [Thermoleophilia bacterium]